MKSIVALGAVLLVVPPFAVADVVVTLDAVEDYVNVRSAPDASSEVLSKLHPGEHLPYLRSIQRWHEVEIGDSQTGFVHRTWTDVISDPSELSSEEDGVEPAIEVETTAADAAENEAAPSEVEDEELREAAAEDIEPPPAADQESEVVADEAELAPAAEEQEPEAVVDEAPREPAVELETTEAVADAMEPEPVSEHELPDAADEQTGLKVAMLQGPPGPRGEQGPPGPAGPRGEPGPPGAADIKGTPNYLAKFTATQKARDSMIFDAGNRVGIGTTEPQHPLEVNGNIQINNRNGNVAALVLAQSSGGSGYVMHNAADVLTLGAGSTDRMAIDSEGNVGIGTPQPQHPLEMSSGAHVTSGGVWTNASSREHKENIVELRLDEAVAALENLTPVRFNYKVDGDDGYVGFIAEDVPELVASKGRQGLSPMDVVAVLTKVVQEQHKKIAELEARLEESKR